MTAPATPSLLRAPARFLLAAVVAVGLLVGGAASASAASTPAAADSAAATAPKVSVRPNFTDPAVAPGEGWEWRGTGSPGSPKGSWYNPEAGESLHPDLAHPDPIGPHHDWKAPDGTTYRVYPDGRVEAK